MLEFCFKINDKSALKCHAQLWLVFKTLQRHGQHVRCENFDFDCRPTLNGGISTLYLSFFNVSLPFVFPLLCWQYEYLWLLSQGYFVVLKFFLNKMESIQDCLLWADILFLFRCKEIVKSLNSSSPKIFNHEILVLEAQATTFHVYFFCFPLW